MSADGGPSPEQAHRPGLAVAYNQILERVALPLGDSILRTEFMRELRRWRRIQELNAPQLETLQRSGLADLLRHATENVPYYRDLRVEPSGDPCEWLRRFPILTKADLRSDGERLLTPGAKNLVRVASSGSSGVQSVLWCTPREISRSQAIQTLWWEWGGYRMGDPLLQTGITPERGRVKRLKDVLLRTDYVVAFGLSEGDNLDNLRKGQGDRWRHIGGYASSLDALARVALAHPELRIEITSALSWGDKLFPHHRRHIADAFGAPVLDTYGTAEGFMIAAQRWNGPYYVMSPHVVVELVDDDGNPTPKGELGHVLVTRLDAHTMPMVRFRLGDLAIEPVESIDVPGAPAFPQLERIIGRETDVWVSPGGRTLTVHTFTGVFEHYDTIEQFSVVPHSRHLMVEYRALEPFDESALEEAGAALMAAVGEELDIRWQRVETIPDSPSGKPQIIRPAER